jgi:predicted dehydrogenase
MQVSEDKAIINLAFADGSIGVINYFANGGKSFPKERVEVFCDNAVLQLDNFKNLKGYGWKGFKNFKTWSQDKGQRNCVKAFMDAVEEGSKPPISHDEIFDNARLSIKIAESLKN